MKKTYITGAIVSGIIHAPLIKEKEYISYALATLLWPIPAVLWSMYTHYALWGTYQHKKKFQDLNEAAADSATRIVANEKSS